MDGLFSADADFAGVSRIGNVSKRRLDWRWPTKHCHKCEWLTPSVRASVVIPGNLTPDPFFLPLLTTLHFIS